MNFVYFQKRALYVAALADLLCTDETLRGLLDTDSVRVAFLKGDLKKPILVLTPTISDTTVGRVEVRLLFGVSLQSYGMKMINSSSLPSYNCVCSTLLDFR